MRWGRTPAIPVDADGWERGSSCALCIGLHLMNDTRSQPGEKKKNKQQQQQNELVITNKGILEQSPNHYFPKRSKGPLLGKPHIVL